MALASIIYPIFSYFSEMKLLDLSSLEEPSLACDVVIINSPVPAGATELLSRLAPDGQIVCADGGADRLACSLVEALDRDVQVVGDLDSVTEDGLKQLGERCRSVRVTRDGDESRCDLEKSLGLLSGSRLVLVLGDMTGRMDQVLSMFHCAFRTRCTVVCIGSSNVAFVVQEGETRVTFPKSLLGAYCGYFPFFGKTKVSTRGLKYDVANLEFEFGSFVSSSNEVDQPEVFIEASAALLFTVSFQGGSVDLL